MYVPTSAAGYPRLYYRAVGAPMLGNFTDTSWYLMRLLSVLLSTVVLAIGLSTIRTQRLPAAAAAVLLACSPAVAAIVSAVNPSGPEIMAGLSAALAAGGLVDALQLGDSRRAGLAALSIAAMITYLTVARPATWSVAVGVLAVVALFAAQPLRELGRRKPSWLAGGFAAIFAAVALGQLLWGVIPTPVSKVATVSWGKALFSYVLPHIWQRLEESVVRVADTDLASWVTSTLLLTLLGVLVTALWLGSRWQRLAMLAGAFGTVVAGPVFAFHSVFTTGTGYQARYALALFSATVALSVATIAERRVSWTTGRLAATIPLGWAMLMLATQVSVFARFAHGLPAPRLTLRVLWNHEWLPPAWPVVLLLIAGMILSAERVSSTVSSVTHPVDSGFRIPCRTTGRILTDTAQADRPVSAQERSAVENDEPDTHAGHGKPTSGADYAERLRRLETARWRRVLNVQAPYRWNVRRLRLGRTLDVGCGLGRNLAHLGGDGVGVDHNGEAIATARARGLCAYTVTEFRDSGHAVPGSFDSILLAHVVEHMSFDEAVGVVREYLPYLRDGGQVCFITPQERGYRTDETHVRFVDFAGLRELTEHLGLSQQRQFSFPFPRAAGKLFAYNEFVVLARKSPAG